MLRYRREPSIPDRRAPEALPSHTAFIRRTKEHSRMTNSTASIVERQQNNPPLCIASV